MDPFSVEGELLNMQNAFHQGQYNDVIDFDTTSLSAQNKLSARILVLRAKLALGQAEEVLDETDGEDDEPDLKAVRALAQYVTGDVSTAVEAVEQLTASSSENPTVQILGGIVLQGAGKSEGALSLLAKHEANLEAVGLIVQIHLQQNRTDLALKEVQAARRWAQDSLLVNLAESWVNLRAGGEGYQQAYYVFEELAQASSTSSTKSLLGQAISEVHLGRLPEAEAALQQAKEKDAKSPDVIANTIVLSAIQGKDTGESVSSLQSILPEYPLLCELDEKSVQFDKAAAKYSPRVGA